MKEQQAQKSERICTIFDFEMRMMLLSQSLEGCSTFLELARIHNSRQVFLMHVVPTLKSILAQTLVELSELVAAQLVPADGELLEGGESEF